MEKHPVNFHPGDLRHFFLEEAEKTSWQDEYPRSLAVKGLVRIIESTGAEQT